MPTGSLRGREGVCGPPSLPGLPSPPALRGLCFQAPQDLCHIPRPSASGLFSECRWTSRTKQDAHAWCQTPRVRRPMGPTPDTEAVKQLLHSPRSLHKNCKHLSVLMQSTEEQKGGGRREEGGRQERREEGGREAKCRVLNEPSGPAFPHSTSISSFQDHVQS